MALSFQIKLYRGDHDNLPATTSVAGVPAFVEDLNALLVGDGSANWDALDFVRGSVKLQATGTTPTDPADDNEGLMIFDTSSDVLYVSNGTAWETISTGATQLSDLTDVSSVVYTAGYVLRANGSGAYVSAQLDLTDVSGDLDDISDGSTYARVLGTYLDAGKVDTIYTVDASPETAQVNDDASAGTGILWSSSKIDTDYVSKVTGHTTGHLASLTAGGEIQDAGADINDSGTGTTDLWTASKIQTEIDNALNGADWQESVLEYITDNTQAPPTEVTGDRYILSVDGGTPNAGWDGASAGDLVEFNGSTWDASTPDEGWCAYSENDQAVYIYNGSAWVLMAGVTSHNALTNLQGGTTDQYYHFTSAQHTEVTTFFANTDITGAEAETLTDGSDASTLHIHDARYYTETEIDTQMGNKQDDVITTKGDLIGGNASGDADRLSVGASGTILQTDPAQPLGFKWTQVLDMGTF